MKKTTPFVSVFLLMLSSLLVCYPVHAGEAVRSDTTIHFNRKMINLTDSNDQVKVKIYETTPDKANVPYKQLYEGIYSDNKSYEKWTVMEELGLQLPIFSRKNDWHHHKYRMESHWAGFGFGYASVTGSPVSLTTVDEFALKAEDSYEMFVNISEKILPIYRNILGITTGLGFNWRKYYLDYNKHLVETNGVTTADPAPDGIKYEYSRLKVVYLTFPLLLEWQPTFGGNHRSFISAGVVGGVKTLSSSKVKYVNTQGHTIRKVEDKGLNVAPLTLDYMVQAGIGAVSVYGKYSPYSLFQNDKGPNVRAMSIGLVLDL